MFWSLPDSLSFISKCVQNLKTEVYPISWASWETPAITSTYMHRVVHGCPVPSSPCYSCQDRDLPHTWNVPSAFILLLLSRFSRVWALVVSDSARPHRWQPTRLPHPWDSLGKNTGVGCHFLLQCMKMKSESEVAQLCPTQRPHGLQPTRLLHPWDFPGQSTGVGHHCLLWPLS